MNFLQLVNRTRSECGISGDDLVTVEGQFGEMARLVRWVSTAYTEIQNLQPWNWLWQPFDQVLTIGQSTYAPVADWGIQPLDWRPSRFYIRENGQPRGQRRRMVCREWAEFDSMHPDPQPGMPLELSIKPSRQVAFSSAPDALYIFEGEFRYTPEVLTENTDTPAMPEQYHMAVVWKAVQLYAQYEEAAALYQLSSSQLAQYLGLMYNSELEGHYHVGALA